jgi:hypothetical protein
MMRIADGSNGQRLSHHKDQYLCGRRGTAGVAKNEVGEKCEAVQQVSCGVAADKRLARTMPVHPIKAAAHLIWYARLCSANNSFAAFCVANHNRFFTATRFYYATTIFQFKNMIHIKFPSLYSF